MQRWLFSRVLILCVAVAGCAPPAPITISGSTMGTVYHVSAYCDQPVVDLEARTRATLDFVNGEMSTYDSASALSQFNRSSVGEWFPVSAAMIEVVEFAQNLAVRSDGAFDVTVGPLVNLFGFGPLEAPAEQPSAAAIAEARARVGHAHLQLRTQPPGLRRMRDLYVDLSAVAKGYGVDAVSATIDAAGCPNHMVEIGGEVFAAGTKPGGERWRIGIETPDAVPGTSISRVVALEDEAVATSGDYRNYTEWFGTRYSHTFDPRLGAPVTHGLASVTVIRPTTLQADGFATLLEVLGPLAGVAFAEKAGLAALFIERTEAGFVTHVTSAMETYLERESS